MRFQIQHQRVRLKWCIVILRGAKSFLIIRFVNKYWISFPWSVCNRKSLRFLTAQIFRGSVPILVFVRLSEYSKYSSEKLNVSPLRLTMFVAASQSKVNGVYKQRVLSKVLGFKIPKKFFSYIMLLLSRL